MGRIRNLAFYSSKAWKDCREAYNSQVHYQCEKCGGVGEIVHHKIHLDEKNVDNPEISLNFDNLILLCRKCHGVAHGRAVDCCVEGFGFDERGQFVKLM